MAHDTPDGRMEGILEFWLDGTGEGRPVDGRHQDMWFKSGRDHDAEITHRFGGDLERAARGGLEPWRQTPRGALALVVLLDQFSRHIHRGTPRAFARDPAAQALVLAGLEQGTDRLLRPVERLFFYMPLEHAEERTLQQRSVDLVGELARSVPEHDRDFFRSCLDSAIRHRDVIERFGRFPHRNRILGRESTPEEIEFLRQPGSSFG